TLTGFENQDYPYEDLVEQVVVNRDVSRNPLFDTMFVLQNTGTREILIPGLQVTPYEYENRTSKFDLTLNGEEVEGKLSFRFEYSTQLFEDSVIRRFSGYFNKIVSTLLGDPGLKLSGIDILSQEERKQLLVTFNDTEVFYPTPASPIRLFQDRAAKTPDHAALGSARGHCLTYKALNERANHLGWVLRGKGVGPGSIIGVMIGRSIAMLVGVLGILKAGGAYLPIDPDYPPERVRYMLEDSQSTLLVAQSKSVPVIGFNGEKIAVDTTGPTGKSEKGSEKRSE
ncbi:MAG: AMP-binding protein, partial [bacterium]|nr:AMP-binding protein [bacterium]